ncbi:MAG: GNAT family N-acetyltransferase [Pirellulales bacterium]|nr:GNAT family N-acetyltransferase [Pirellulales bacterium]
MWPSTKSVFSIVPVPSAERQEALELVFSHLAAEQRREQIEAMQPPPSGRRHEEIFIGAYRDGRLVGAGIAQVQPGRILQVWLPRLVADQSPETALGILEALLEPYHGSDIVLAQVMLESTSPQEEELLRQGSFDHLADLLYMVCPESVYPEIVPISPLQFDSYDSADSARFARLVESTYCDTQDCPRLNDVRRIEDVLAGYRATGVFDPRRWYRIRQRDEEIGCLLLADHPAYGNMELVYMGVVPSARGRGRGLHIARFAQWQARQADRTRLVLAVDEANQPALQVYAAAGFQPWDRRRVYFRILQQLVAS